VSLVVAGNFLSSQGRREDALRCFARASQAAPRYAYPLSLSGAELALLDRREEARAAYRAAVTVDPRHYRSWCGLAQLCEGAAGAAQAQSYATIAARTHPNSAAVRIALGKTLAARGLLDDAAKVFDQVSILRHMPLAARKHPPSTHVSGSLHTRSRMRTHVPPCFDSFFRPLLLYSVGAGTGSPFGNGTAADRAGFTPPGPARARDRGSARGPDAGSRRARAAR
jgi:hypothetical protein